MGARSGRCSPCSRRAEPPRGCWRRTRPHRAACRRRWWPAGCYDKPGLTRAARLGRRSAAYAEAHVRHERVDGVTEETTFQAKRCQPVHLDAGERLRPDRCRAGVRGRSRGRGPARSTPRSTSPLTSSLAIRAGMTAFSAGSLQPLARQPAERIHRPSAGLATELLGVALSEPGAGACRGSSAWWRRARPAHLRAVRGERVPRRIDHRLPGQGPGSRWGGGTSRTTTPSPAVVGRVGLAPRRWDWRSGLSGHYGAYNVFRSGWVRQVDDRRNLTIWVADARGLGAQDSG